MRENRAIFALCGKGGVGKTSVSAAIVKILSGLGSKKVLAIDADPAVGLASALGIVPRRTIDDIRNDLIRDVRDGTAMDKQELVSRIDYDVFDAIEEKGNLGFLAIGRPETEGCYCRVNSFLKEIIETTAGHFDYVVIDGEAGIEQVNRRVMDAVDHLLLVSDASAKGLNVVNEIYKTAARTVKFRKAALVLNRIRSQEEAKAAIERTTLEVGGWIPEDDTIREFDIQGRSILELPDCPSLRAVASILEQVAGEPS
ncbi:MAG: cobyrinic acid a,c-diamide synthase [Desulfococcus sp. 4484_241]|nr:MAG: cobyrinic acid a,c-diamide synthase [Desulfococcus sp. 4484_241]